ncbi:MAG: 30S ribosomal protein S13 [Thermoplasmata archaeon]|nr:MAG: 30S ribosomal protein S13 [Thermoplasmata archaeon]
MAEEIKHVVRLVGKDLDGTKAVHRALCQIKGVSFSFARAVAYAAGVDPFRRLGALSDEEIAKLEQVLKNPLEHGIPSWMLNRRKDFVTGKDLHLLEMDIDLTVRADIGRERRIRSRRGIRHELGLPVRGQRTRTTGRKGMTVGVSRKKEGQPSGEKKEEKKK